MASTHPAPRPDRASRLLLAALSVAGGVTLVWLTASLARSAFF